MREKGRRMKRMKQRVKERDRGKCEREREKGRNKVKKIEKRRVRKLERLGDGEKDR